MARTITLSVSDNTFELMRKHPEINYSELARQKINEYLASLSEKRAVSFDFLVLKDLIFATEKIVEIHNRVEKNHKMMRTLSWAESVFDLDLFDSISKFLHEFARVHPFEDGNKRASFVCVDAFLRLNFMKLRIDQSSRKTTDDEKFFWQNANRQKPLDEIRAFLKKHVVESKRPKSVEAAVLDSISENKILLKRLAL